MSSLGNKKSVLLKKIEKDSGWLEFRCKKCNKLLGQRHSERAGLEIKCLRCGLINSLLEDDDKQIFLTNSCGKILFINDLVYKFTGYLPKEVIGKTPAVWGRQMPKSFYKNLWNKILENKQAITVNLTNKKKTGELYEVCTRISPILDESGEVKYFLGIQTLVVKN